MYGHVLTNMESMIHYFKLVTEGYTLSLPSMSVENIRFKNKLGIFNTKLSDLPMINVGCRSPSYRMRFNVKYGFTAPILLLAVIP